MTRKTLILSVVSITVVATLTLWLVARQQHGRGVEPILVAANLPLTGFLSNYGAAVRDGALMAVDDYRDSSEVAARIRFDWQDNASDATKSLPVAERQLGNSPKIYVSGIGPALVHPILQRVGKAGIPHFVWTFDVKINPPSGAGNNLRTNVSYKLEPIVYLDYARSREAQRVAIVHLLLPHAVEEFESLVIPGLKAMGIEHIHVEPFPVTQEDFSDLALRIRSFQPNLIILNGFASNLVGQIRALAALDLISENGNTIATYDLMDAADILDQSELVGVRFVAPAFLLEPSELTQGWRTRFLSRFGREPIYTNAFAYDALTAVITAGSALDSSAEPPDWLRALREVNFPGVTGTIRFDEDGDLLVELAIGHYVNGQPILLSRHGLE